MLSINTNLSSLIAQRSMKQSTNKLNQAIERMTTGAKINHAKDNAANYSISTNMTTKIGSYNVAEDNCAMGLDMIASAEGSLSQIQDKLQRLRDLQEQASNGTYGEKSLEAINAEVNAVVDEINRIYSNAEYNGLKLFGTNAGNAAPIATYAMTRATSYGYSDEEIAEMTTLTEAFQAGAFVEGETYSISTVDELEKFRDMVNAGNSGAGSTFVLTKDLNLSGISNWTPIGNDANNMIIFSGVFDGNGHVISNLKINDTSGMCQGLFGIVGATLDKFAELKNLGLENVNIDGRDFVGALAGGVLNKGFVNIFNNYSTGTVSGMNNIGGLVGGVESQATTNICNNYSTVTVEGEVNIGGLLGCQVSHCAITNIIINFAAGNVSGNQSVGGLVGGVNEYGGYLDIVNCYATGTVTGLNDVGGFIGGHNGDTEPTITNCASVQSDDHFIVAQLPASEILLPANLQLMGFTEANGWTIKNGTPVLSWQLASPSGGSSGGGSTGSLAPDTIALQVGTSSNGSSQIGVSTTFVLNGIDDLRMIGLDMTTDYLEIIDDMLGLVSEKQTHFGAVSNRLESVLEEIIISRDNLVSARSTIQDADIAEVSSEYIRQQILQQASATLLATANQSPSIALQLI